MSWVFESAFTGDGARVLVRADFPLSSETLRPHVPPLWRAARPTDARRVYSLRRAVSGGKRTADAARYTLSVGQEREEVLHTSPDLARLLEALESELHFHAAVSARRWLYVHAGVVSWDGTAVLIPGRSMSGKSTLVEALVRAGASYASDEFAVLDRQGRAHPYPKAPSLPRAEADGRGPLAAE